MKQKGFKCGYCSSWVLEDGFIGTAHRDHCPFCLWSKHLDLKESGDRKSECLSLMEPIGLTFKQEGPDKYGKLKQGEIMVIHQCTGCGKNSINRIAADDRPETILEVFEKSQKLGSGLKRKLEENNIKPVSVNDKKEIMNQLFGKG